MHRSGRISHWDAEDLAAWEAGNKTIARRNLLWAVVTVHLGYSVWTLCPVMELFMPRPVYGFSAGDKFLLATTATYFMGFIALFILSGLGNGSVYKMIPTIFEACGRSLRISDAERRDWSRLISGIVIGLVAGVGALGGVGIDLALRESYVTTGTGTSAFWIFALFYAATALLTWKAYVRRSMPPVRPSEPPTPPEPAAEPAVLKSQPDRFSGCSISA